MDSKRVAACLSLLVHFGLICSICILCWNLAFANGSCVLKGLLNKRPGDRLGWPGLLDHPFVRESAQERTKREAALADAVLTAQESRAWKGEGGAVAGPLLHMMLCCWCACAGHHKCVACTVVAVCCNQQEPCTCQCHFLDVTIHGPTHQAPQYQ